MLLHADGGDALEAALLERGGGGGDPYRRRLQLEGLGLAEGPMLGRRHVLRLVVGVAEVLALLDDVDLVLVDVVEVGSERGIHGSALEAGGVRGRLGA